MFTESLTIRQSSRARLGASVLVRLCGSLAGLLLALCGLSTHAQTAASTSQRPSVIREVVRSADYAQLDPGLWPRKVPVREGDPLTGKAQALEIWSYSAEFARRFAGFDETLADPAMPTGTHAVVQRIYKADYRAYPTPPWVFNDHVCMTEIFFDSKTPVTQTSVESRNFRPGLRNFIALDVLEAKDPSDQAALRTAQQRPATALQTKALMFTDGLARDIAGTMRIFDYRQTIVPGISWMEAGPGQDGCAYFYPRPKDSLMVLALADYDPNENPRRNRRGQASVVMFNQYLPLNHDYWKWQPADMARGIIALPAGFTQRATEVSAWMSDQRYCLGYERSTLRKGPDRTQEEFEKSVVGIKQQCATLRSTGQLNFHFAVTPNPVQQRYEVIPGVPLANPRR